MFYINDTIELKALEKYGFKIGENIPDNKRCICNASERKDYWLISMGPDESDKVLYANDEFDQPLWSIHVHSSSRRVYIDCVPSYTYHIDNLDMEEMFYTLKCMIEDGIIIDTYGK